MRKAPPKLNYVAADGEFFYDTNSKNTDGSINSVEITGSGREYKKLPGISSVTSINGKDALLNPTSFTIGRITDVDIQDIGFDYPSDRTLRPQAQIPQLVKLDALSSIKSIGITSVGTNYLNSPGLVVLDGLTQKKVEGIDLDYELGDTEVTILRNSRTLNNFNPTIIPVDNSNGITINNVDFNSGTKDVTVTIGASFSDAADYPFEVGKKYGKTLCCEILELPFGAF